jgi:D-aminopeptidase
MTRYRDLGLTVGQLTPGPLNAITDVAGVRVGMTTLIRGEGPLVVGEGPVRTGVTAIVPHDAIGEWPVFAGCHTLNGNGEMTGLEWLRESGQLTTAVAITNTHSVGVVRDAIVANDLAHVTDTSSFWSLPVVAETYDGGLNDINGMHVRPEHLHEAIASAANGPVPEGNVGGGTGMRCLGFKGGIGTASRVLPAADGGYVVGVLVQCNFGARQDLRVAGVPVGDEITDLGPCVALDAVRPQLPRCGKDTAGPGTRQEDQGSIIVVVATSAPLLPHQLKRLATRVALGVGRTGGFGGNGSGDIFLAFSTANATTAASEGVQRVEMLPNPRMNALFYATVQATEEAILNAMLAATTMTGADGLRVHALPHDRLLAALRKHGRLR